MSISSCIFADHIVNIAVTGPLVRIEFGMLQRPGAEGQKPQLVPTQTLVMPLDGFVDSFGMLESVVTRLVESGAVARRSATATTAGETGSAG